MPISDEALALSRKAFEQADVQLALSIRGREYGQSSDAFHEMFQEELTWILGKTPLALSDCPSNALARGRIAAAMITLWGVSRLREVRISVEESDYRFDTQTIAYLLTTHAAYLRTLLGCRRAGISQVRLLGSGLPGVCSVCRAADGKKYAIDRVPELPLVRCRCAGGCKMIVGAYDPELDP